MQKFLLLIYLFAITILAGCEILFVKGFFLSGDYIRMNTIFKFYFQAWLYLSLGLPLIIREIFNSSRLKKYIILPILFVIFLLSALTSTSALIGKLKDERTTAGAPTLYGFYYKKLTCPGEYDALLYLVQHISDYKVICEAVGPIYGEYGRVSMNTGLPTILGWDNHISQRGFSGEEIERRKKAVNTIYTSTDKQAVAFALWEYGVDYVYVGKLEKDMYSGGEEMTKFATWQDLFHLAYSNDDVKIYEVLKPISFLQNITSPLPSSSTPNIPYWLTLKPVNPFKGGEGKAPGEFREPRDICIDSTGNLYVVDFRNFRIQKFTQKGKFLGGWGEEGKGEGEFNDPSGIAYSPSTNTIWVADCWNHRLQEFTPEGKFLKTIKWEFYGPRDLTVDNTGNLYVADTGNNRIVKFSKEGKFLQIFSECSQPWGITWWQGKLVVVESTSGKLKLFSHEGKLLQEQWISSPPLEDSFLTSDTQNIYMTLTNSGEVVKISFKPTSPQSSFAKGKGVLIKSSLPAEAIYQGLNSPTGITYWQGKLFICERNNNRLIKLIAR